MTITIADGPGAEPMDAEADCAPAGRVTDCFCYACEGSPVMRSRMYVCAKCGNKRCPHATDHRLPCTGSNEPDQPGSAYSDVSVADALRLLGETEEP